MLRSQDHPSALGELPRLWSSQTASQGLNSLRRHTVRHQPYWTTEYPYTGILALQQVWPRARILFSFEITQKIIYMGFFFLSFLFPSTHLCLQQCMNKVQLIHKCLCTAWLCPAIPSRETGHLVWHSAQHGKEEWNQAGRPGEAATNAWCVERQSAHLEAPKCVWNLFFLVSVFPPESKGMLRPSFSALFTLDFLAAPSSVDSYLFTEFPHTSWEAKSFCEL